MAADPPEMRRVRLPSGRAVSLLDLAGVPGGSWEARAVGSHYIVQRAQPDGSQDTVTGKSTLDMALSQADAEALAAILNAPLIGSGALAYRLPRHRMTSPHPPAGPGRGTTGEEPAPSSGTDQPPARPGPPTPDKEGGAPVDELDLDGDGSHRE
jgi:hypothetical protein